MEGATFIAISVTKTSPSAADLDTKKIEFIRKNN